MENGILIERSEMKKGFTLSEILICLGIVGTVAALTIPSVMKNYQKRVLTTQLQKTYLQISTAAQTIMDTEHVDNFYNTSVANCPSNNCPTGITDWMNNYFLPIKKNCGKGGKNQCIAGVAADSYKTLDGTNAGAIGDRYCIQTSDGAAICGLYNNKVGNNLAQPCLTVVVDVNGPAEPNIIGRDVFSMDIHTDGSISDYGSGCGDNAYGCPASECGTRVGNIFERTCGCLTSVVEAGWKMEY